MGGMTPMYNLIFIVLLEYIETIDPHLLKIINVGMKRNERKKVS